MLEMVYARAGITSYTIPYHFWTSLYACTEQLPCYDVLSNALYTLSYFVAPNVDD